MKVWTVEEIQSLIANITDFNARREVFMERYEALGGIPRNIFFPPNEISLDEEIETIVKKCKDIELLTNFTKLHSLACPDECHVLLHMTSRDVEHPYIAGGFEFASRRLAFALADEFKKISLQSLTNAFNFLRNKGVGTLAGDLFEPLVIFLLQDGYTFFKPHYTANVRNVFRPITKKLGPSEKG